MFKKLQARLSKLKKNQQQTLLQGGLKGIEKEGLRITPAGFIAQTPHPISLGSTLTHPHITTDYSEALLELITPAFADIKETLKYLHALHQFVYQHLDDELIWVASMPCKLASDQSIPIAEYGSSNIGRIKHIYRHGLSYRYGRAMQAISGVHYNYSIPEDFWPVYQNLENDQSDLQDFISQSYMGLIRNFQRIGWIVSYLFGASPSVCPSFVELRRHEFEQFDCSSCNEENATSLRMSDIGYKNSNQDGIDVSYNSLSDYVASLKKAIKTPSAEYEKIGVQVDGQYRQLNANILQIENEYYSFVRPKQIAGSGETPSHALKTRGIRYVEIRALDINPFDPIGLNEQQLHFMEALLIYCLLQDSPTMDAAARQEFEANQSATACSGREAKQMLSRNGEQLLLTDWLSEILTEMGEVCQILDEGNGQAYQQALQAQIEKLRDPSLLPSSQVAEGIEQADQSFFNFALEKSEQHKAYFDKQPVPKKCFQQLTEMAGQSMNEQLALEEMEQAPFDQYLKDYLA